MAPQMGFCIWHDSLFNATHRETVHFFHNLRGKMSGDWVAKMCEGNGSVFCNITEEDNLTCAAHDIQGSIDLPYSTTLTTTVRVLQSIFFFLLIPVGLILNSFVLVLMAKYKKLRSLSQLLVLLQVIVLDLLLLLSLIASLVTTLANKWLFGEYMCAITGLLASVTSLTRIFLMGIYVLDRFLFTFWPNFYQQHKFKIVGSLSVASWVFSVIVGITMLPGLLDCYRFTPNGKICLLSSQCSYTCAVFVRLYGIVVGPATILIIASYAVLIYFGRKVNKVDLLIDETANDNQPKEVKPNTDFSVLFLSLSALVLVTTTIGVIVFAIDSDEQSAVSYALLVINTCSILLYLLGDPILIMLDENVKEVLVNEVALFKKFKRMEDESSNTPENVKNTEL